MTYVLYHANCTDGFGAAYSAWKKLKNTAKYKPVKHGGSLPSIQSNSTVYVVDFCLTANQIKFLQNKGCEVITLDHHVTARVTMKLSNHYVYDVNKSGALITHEYFHGPGTQSKLIDHISDRDLWTWKLPDTEPILMALDSYPADFEIWADLEKNLEKLLHEGEPIMRYRDVLVQRIIDSSKKELIIGNSSGIGCNTSVLQSEVCHKLLAENCSSMFSFCYSTFQSNKGEKIKWSLRSNPDRFDVSRLAQQFGGGGHKGAAGMVTNIIEPNIRAVK